MISSHAVSKSTFRISIVAAVVAAAYTAYEGWQSNVQAYNGTLQMVLTYECGGAQSDDNLRAALNVRASTLARSVAPTGHFSGPPTTRLYKREKESYGERNCLIFRCSE